MAAALAHATPAAPAAEAALEWSNASSPAGGPVQSVGGSTAALVASTWSKGTYRSTDNGLHWSLIENFPDVNEARVVFDPTNPLVGYVAGFGGIARTRDAGETWDLIVESVAVYRIDVSPTGRVVASIRDDNWVHHIKVSDDHGDTWTEIIALPQFTSMYGLEFGRHDDEVYVMSISASWWTHDGGATWQHASEGGLDLEATEDGTLWRVGFGPLKKSTDGGDTWTLVNVSSSSYPLAARPGGGLYMATFDGILLTLDGGDSWINMGYGDATFGALWLLPDPYDADAVFMTDENVGIVRVGPDGNGGYLLEGRTTGLPPVPVIAVGSSDDGSLYLAGSTLGVYVSRDGADTWAHSGFGGGFMGIYSVDANADGSIAYAGGQNRVFQPFVLSSRDGGRTFTYEHLDVSGDGRTTAVVAHPEDPQRAYAIVRGDLAPSAVFETTDGGASWEKILDARFIPISVPLLAPPLLFFDGAYHEASDSLLVATNVGVIRLDDVGAVSVASYSRNVLAVASEGDVAYASGSVVKNVWRSAEGLPLLAPWGDSPATTYDLAADRTRPDTLWGTSTSGQLFSCGGDASEGACTAESFPTMDAERVFVSPDGSRAFVATRSAGLHSAALV